MTTENSNTRPEYYGYFVSHVYISQIQHGIQAAHVIQAMYEKYANSRSRASNIFKNWMMEDKTMIVLNGGNSAMIKDAMKRALIIDRDGLYPMACFCEDSQSMEGMMTGWGIVLPKVDRNEWEYNIHCGAYLDSKGYSADVGTALYLAVLSNLKLA